MSVHRKLDELIAIHLFNWKWMAWVGTPVRSTPGYPKHCRVRQFMPPETYNSHRWRETFAAKEGREATGDEPLSYRYCSSMSLTIPLDCHGDGDFEVLDYVRGTWKGPRWDCFVRALPRIEDYRLGDFSRAVVKALELA